LLNADHDISFVSTHHFRSAHQAKANHGILPQADATRVSGGSGGQVIPGDGRRMRARRLIPQARKEIGAEKFSLLGIQRVSGQNKAD
jgi:hypothetical protein